MGIPPLSRARVAARRRGLLRRMSAAGASNPYRAARGVVSRYPIPRTVSSRSAPILMRR